MDAVAAQEDEYTKKPPPPPLIGGALTLTVGGRVGEWLELVPLILIFLAASLDTARPSGQALLN